MAYQWWVFVHLVGVFGLLVFHGVSIWVMFQLRKERDPARVNTLLQLSSSTITPFYYSLLLLLGGGIVATFLGHLWGYGWIWAAVGTLVVIVAVMAAMARSYYRRVRTIAQAKAEGSEAVSDERFDHILSSGRVWVVSAVGFGGLLFILYLMLFKPALGLSPSPAREKPPQGEIVRIGATELAFSTDRLEVPAGEPFSIELRNRSSNPHNVAIYTDDSATEVLFRGKVFAGPGEALSPVEPLEAGEYFFRCDVHPTVMTGTVVAG